MHHGAGEAPSAAAPRPSLPSGAPARRARPPRPLLPWAREPRRIRRALQVLRSVDRWSAGTAENSILNAYLHTIRGSQHFLYIEVCGGAGGGAEIGGDFGGPGPGAAGGRGLAAEVCLWSLPQNQFFISCSDGRTVLNKVGDEIVDRILKAHR